jgi:hypothetical protein
MNQTVDGYVNGTEMSVLDFESNILSYKKIVANPAGGNCLFHSLSYLVKKTFPKKADSITNKTIREDICDYYEKTFRSKKSASAALTVLSNGSLIEKQLFQLYTFGSEPDETGNFTLEHHNIDHQQEVCKKTVWGEEVDIVVACILYNINIVVFSLLPSSNYSKQPIYRILTYKNSDSVPTCYLHLKMNGDSSHYEAMYDRSHSRLPKIPSASKTEKAKSKSKSSSEKRTTRKGKYESVLEKLNTFYEKIEKFVPTGNKEVISNEFSDIQLQVVTMISALEAVGSRSSEIFSEKSSQNQKKMDELASLKAMLILVSKKDKSKIQRQIEDLESQLQ